MAHIMNYEELRQIRKGEAIFEQLKNPSIGPIVYPLYFDGTDFINGTKYLLLCECDEEECMDYNWCYRCWNELPTLEEMNTPWKDNPYE